MTTFDQRETAFENKFAHDEDMLFRASARRNKLTGLWAAGLLGKSGAEAEEYAKTVVIADMEEAGDEDVIRKLTGDLGDLAAESTIREKLAEMMITAKGQLLDEV